MFLFTSKNASPVISTLRSLPENTVGKRREEAAFSHTFVPSGNTSWNLRPRGVVMVLKLIDSASSA